MPIFKTTGGKLVKLSALPLDKEKSLQQLVEENLFEVLEMCFLATEYVTTFGGRIDTLAVDMNGSPVIIEYKRNKNDNVINQALSYLKWLKTQKAGFFEKLMIDKLGGGVADRIKLDWHNPRVVCIAESYSKFDIDTVEVVPLRIELLRYRLYEEGIFSLQPVSVSGEQAIEPRSIDKKNIKRDDGGGKTSASLDNLLAKATPAIQRLYEELRERIIALDENIAEKATSYYVAYRTSNNFAEVHIGKSQIKLLLRPIEYDDPKGLIAKVPDTYKWTLDRRAYLETPDELDYVMSLVEQSYKTTL